MRLAALALPALLVAAGGCRTGPWDLDHEGPGGAPRPDGGRDLARPPVIDLALGPAHCGVHAIETTHVTRADLLIVLDRSRSMNERVGGGTKWELTRAAIKQVVSGTASVDWGLLLFGSDDRCNVRAEPDVPVGPGKAAAIRAALDGATLYGSTPTTTAMKNAVAYFGRLADGHPHHILLATDGQPSCAGGPGTTGRGDDSPAAIAAVQSAADAGVTTFVVGIGSTGGAEQTLERMALAGGARNAAPGQPAYFPVASAQELARVLEQAAIRITPCAYPVGAEPPDRERVTIQGSSGVIPRDRTRRDGWDYGDDGKDFVFYGPTCEALRGGAVTAVRAIYACPDR